MVFVLKEMVRLAATASMNEASHGEASRWLKAIEVEHCLENRPEVDHFAGERYASGGNASVLEQTPMATSLCFADAVSPAPLQSLPYAIPWLTTLDRTIVRPSHDF